MCKHARPSSDSRRAAAWSASFRLLRLSPLGLGAVSALLLGAALAPQATAQTVVTYNGASATPNDFGTAGNYAGGVLPSTTNGDTAQFDGTYAGNLSLIYSNGAFNGASPEPGIMLSLTGTQTGSVSIDAGTNTNQIRLGGITIASGAGALTLGDGANVFAFRLGGGMGATNTFTNNSANTATVNSDVAIALGANADHTLSVGGTGNWLFKNALVNNANGTTGTLSFTKTGTGTVTLNSFSTYTGAGGTTVNGGTLALASGGSAGAVRGVVTVNTGATLSLTVGDAVGYASDGSQVTTVNVNGGTVTSGNFNEGFNTSYNLTGGTVSAGGLYRFNVNAATPATISSLASGTTSVFAANIDDFPANGTAGSLGVNVATGTTASGIDLTISGVIQSGGGLTKTGSGYLNLTGQNTFAGPVVITGGTLNIGTGGNNNGASAIGTTNAAGKTITVNAGATLSGKINNWFGNGAGTNPLITVNGGTLTTSRYTAIGALALNGATVTNTGTQDQGNYQAFQLRGDVTVGGTSSSTISSTTVTSTAGGYHLNANTTFTVASTNGSTPGRPTGDLVVNAPLINQSGDFGNATGGLTKAGAGTMALNATNTYRGTTTVSAGTLLISGSINSSPTVSVTAGALTLSNTAATVLGDAATLSLSNGTMFSLNAASGTSETIGYLVLGGTTESAGTYTAAQLMTLDPNITFSSSLGETLTVTAVPEPATWFAGFLLVGVAIGSQRRKLSDWLYAVRG